MKGTILILLLSLSSYIGYAQNKLRIEKIKSLTTGIDQISEFEFHEASKYSFKNKRVYPYDALLFKKNKILYAEQNRKPEFVRPYSLENKQREFMALFRNSATMKLQKSEIKKYGIGQVLMFYYSIDTDQFITYFTELDSTGAFQYGNLQFNQIDKNEAEKLLNAVLSAR